MGEQSNEFANSLCFPRGRQRDRQRFGECLSSTLLVATSPATRANLQRRRNPLNWKLLQSSHLPAMSRSRSFAAARTRSASVTLRRYHPAVPTERHGLHDNPGPESQFRCLRHPPDNAETTDQRKSSTKSDADPNAEGKRLHPNIADFRHWRETLAEETRHRHIQMEELRRFEQAN